MKEDSLKLPAYPLFDWLRFTLASVVALSHSGIIRWTEAGGLAVHVFFALSGWLIGSILIDGEPKSLPRFYFNRVTRIWFPYFATVAALYTLSAIRDPITAGWFKFLVYDVTFTHNWFSLWPDPQAALAQMPLKGTGNHFWSIAVEEQFYLLAPAMMYLNRSGRNPLLWVILSILLLVTGHADFAAIAAGVGAACARKKWGAWHTERGATLILVAIFVATAALMRSATYYYYVAPLFSITVVLLAARTGERGRLGMFLGAISYPMYLNAWIGTFAANAIMKYFMPELSPLGGYLDYVGAVLFGALAYFAIDHNVLAWRNGWYSPTVGWAAALAAYVLWACGLVFGMAVIFQAV